jgi:hypothetical protein
MVRAGVTKANVAYQNSYPTQFTGKKVGLDLRPN